MAEFNSDKDYFEYFRHSVLNGNICYKSDSGKDYDAKVNKLLKQVIESCDNEFHNAVMFGIFSSGIAAGKQQMCRICKENKNNTND